jgi:molecular chaperone DnaJ
MTLARDYYETLGIGRDASESDIKVAYRKLALRYHPDRNPGDIVAEERFKELSTAYAILSVPDKKEHYDRFGFLGDANPFSGANVASATDFFDAIFGDLLGLGRRKKSTGRDLRYTLEIDFEEAALGCHKTIAFDRAEDCAACRGSGAEGGVAGLMKCGRCGGQGFQRQSAGLLGGRRECAVCGGTGEVPRVNCKTCEGAGIVDKWREFDVSVPPRTTSGSTQRVAGQGSPGRRGDLHVVVRVRPHRHYVREGEILVVEVPVSMTEAALGAEVDVPVLDGLVKMRVPAGTQSGSVFRIRGKGMPQANGGRGDCHVRVSIETPVNLTPEARDLLTRVEGVLGSAATPGRRDFRAQVTAHAGAATAGAVREGAASAAAAGAGAASKATRARGTAADGGDDEAPGTKAREAGVPPYRDRNHS